SRATCRPGYLSPATCRPGKRGNVAGDNEEQAAKEQYWKIPICYDDDEDDTIAITPVLPTEEPVNSLSMGDEHLDTILETESDKFIKSSVENLVPTPSESEDFSDIECECDLPLRDDSPESNFTNLSNPLFDTNRDHSV
ncbi:hypothetical protein Tco_0094967, partial [Tanacetum coccineum]